MSGTSVSPPKLGSIDMKDPPLPVAPLDPNSLEACRLRYGPRESLRVLKNLVVLGLAFVMLFSAFLATANLQSSINQEDGLGTYALASVYALFILTSMFLPPLVIYKLRSKTTMIVVISGYALYVAAQFQPTFYTLVPAAAYLGICGANLWAASSAYITRLAQEYAYLNKLSFSSILQQFFGAFFLFFHSSQIWGNLISASVLATGGSDNDDDLHSEANSSIFLQEKDLSTCGAQFCPFIPGENPTGGQMNPNSTSSAASTAFAHPEMYKIYLLFGIYTGCSIAAAVIIFLFLDPAARYGELDLKNKAKPKALELLVATIRHWRKPTQILIIPISVWTGMQEAFVGAEFTMAFISCAWGIEYIGLVMLCFGVCASIFSMIVGQITERVGRPLVFCIAGLMNLGCLLAMLHWVPSPDQPFVYFSITGAWGIADGVWSAQVKALYADVFPNTAEAAFSNAGIWISVGFIIVYMIAGRLCMSAKTYICIGVLVVAIGCYLFIEVIESRKKKQRKLATKAEP